MPTRYEKAQPLWHVPGERYAQQISSLSLHTFRLCATSKSHETRARLLPTFSTACHAVSSCGWSLPEQVFRTGKADTVAGIASHSGHLVFPADADLTPGTFHQEIALTERSELLLVFSIFRLEMEKPGVQLVSLPHHMGT
jgi:hypothetical protein